MSISRRERIMLNISGARFETYVTTLTRFPNTLLGDEKKRRLHYCSKGEQYYFNRNRGCFEAILYYYQSNGTLNCPAGVRISIFEEECRYFELQDEVIKRMKQNEGVILHEYQVTRNHSLREKVWNILEHPETSCAAWIFAMSSLLIVWVSIVSCSMETMHEFHMHFAGSGFMIVWGDHWSVMELTLNVYFLVELVLRVAFTTDRVYFFRRMMNWVDVVAVVPYFILLMLKSNKRFILGICKTLKFMRVMRLFRLSKHSRRIKVVGKILKSSLSNLRILMVCLFIVILMGGTFIFHIENHENECTFTSIPASLWWAVQTITSVGYGDMIPATIMGRTFACCFMLFGAVTISLPVLTIVSQFTVLYPKNVECEEYQYKS